MRNLRQKLDFLYPDKAVADYAYEKISSLINENKNLITRKPFFTEKDVFLETYPDNIKSENQSPLSTLNEFLVKHTKGTVTNIKLTPHYPYTSDDGYSVSDYYSVNPEAGNWDDVQKLCDNFGVLFELVLNHTSKSNIWFKKFINCEEGFEDFYLTGNPDDDHSSVTRPRALPLFTKFETAKGPKYVWTTFSDDQVDVNFKNPDVLIQYIKVVLFYGKMGARVIGMDAVGFIWKEKNTTCMHLEQTHEIIKLMRYVVEQCLPGVMFVTETNVPHQDNISYFGESDETNLVYQFVLPPLTLYSFLSQDAGVLTKWAQNLAPAPHGCSFFNFLASHDGIGLRPLEGILSDEETLTLVENCKNNGGFVNMRNLPDGSQKAYELNINYMDALTPLTADDSERAKRMIAAHSIIMSLQGVPLIYIHSLIGSRNWREGVLSSGINRRINREKLAVSSIEKDINNGTIRKTVIDEMCRLLEIRGNNTAFSPLSEQEVLSLDNRLFSVLRHGKDGDVLCITNVSDDVVDVVVPFEGKDLISGQLVNKETKINPLSSIWILKSNI